MVPILVDFGILNVLFNKAEGYDSINLCLEY